MGDVNQKVEGIKLFDKLKIKEKVTFLPFRTDVPDILSASDIYVLPSLWEGLPIGLLEAMAMQLPCITSSLANNALKAKHLDQIIVADSPEDYAAFILELLTDEAKASKIAMNGYNYVTSNFNWSASAIQLSNLFSKGK